MFKEYDSMTDEQLAALAREGDVQAEEALIRKYKGLIKTKAHLYFIVGADTEDVMQEGMIGFVKAIRGYREGRQAAFKTYAELCINRQIISAVKQAGRMKYLPLNTSVSINEAKDEEHEIMILDLLSAGLEDDPETVLLMKEKMAGLENEGKKFFSAFENKVLSEFLQGKSYIEIGKMMEKSPKSIDNALQRIRKKLESHLGNL